MSDSSPQSDFQSLVDACRAKALLGVLSPSEAHQYRYVCRVYSKTFHTPLATVLSMDPEQVILSFFEEQMDGLDSKDDIDKVLEMIYEMEDPNYAANKKKAQDEFDMEFEKKEANRVLKGLPIHPSMGKAEPKNTSEKVAELDPNLPTGGSLDTSLFNQNEES